MRIRPLTGTVLLAALLACALTGCSPATHAAASSCPTPAPPSPIPETPDAQGARVSDDVTVTARSAMSDSDFWTLIGRMPRRASSDDFDRLSARLQHCSLRSLVAYDARLTLLLYALDTAAPCLWYAEHGGFPGPV